MFIRGDDAKQASMAVRSFVASSKRQGIRYAPKVAAGAQGETGRRGGSPHVRCCRPATRAHRSTARILPSKPSAGHQKQFRIPLLNGTRNLSLESTLIHAASRKAYSANGTASQESNTSAQRRLGTYCTVPLAIQTSDAEQTMPQSPSRGYPQPAVANAVCRSRTSLHLLVTTKDDS